MRRTRFNVLAGFILVLSLLVTACGNGSGTGSKSGASSEKDQAQGTSSNKKYAQGVTDTEIKIGNWVPQTGSVAQFAASAHGAQSYFNKVNAEGGINGRKIKLISLDDQYEPSRAVAAAKKLLEEDKVFALVMAFGTAGNKAAKAYIEKLGIPIFPHSGSTQFMDPPTKNYFGVVSNYETEARLFVKYLDESLKVKKVGVFYQNDDTGKLPFQVFKEGVEKRGIEIVETYTHPANDVDYSSAAIKMKAANPDIIVGFSGQSATATFWKEYKKLGGDKQMVNSSSAGQGQGIYDLVGKEWEGNLGIDAYRSLDDTSDPKVKEFLDHFKKDYPNDQLDIGKMGWSAAQIAVEALKRSGDELTWENYIKQVESIKDWDGSLLVNVSYSPTDRYGPTGFYMTQAKNGKVVKVSDVIKYQADK